MKYPSTNLANHSSHPNNRPDDIAGLTPVHFPLRVRTLGPCQPSIQAPKTSHAITTTAFATLILANASYIELTVGCDDRGKLK